MACSLCGCTGIHACIGFKPDPWTEEEKSRLEAAMKKISEACQHDWCSDGDPGPGERMTLQCRHCGEKQLAVPSGYTAEELERDNPYNQWMRE